MAVARVVQAGPGLPLALSGRDTALLVVSGRLSGHAEGDLLPGDLLTGPPARLGQLFASAAATLLVEEREEPGFAEERRIGRAALVGTGVPGVSGVRVLARAPGGALLRLGPPPGARWLVTGLRAVAVFAGRLLIFEGAAPLVLSIGGWYVVPRPEATLPLQAGNDSALAVAFTAPDVRVELG